MTPINTKHTNLILGAPQGWDVVKHGVCVGLPILKTEDPYMYSWWKVSFKDRFKILFGRPIRLCIVGNAHPPIALQVTDDVI